MPYTEKMPNEKTTFRLWPDARAKLFEEVAHYRAHRPPIGEFVSRLIEMCPDKLWSKVRAVLDAKYDEW
jgi:hypothetical protein